MSDPKSSYGEPVDEPNVVDHRDDVVGRAHEGLAEAEAAQRDVDAPAGVAAVTPAAYDAEQGIDRTQDRAEPARVDGEIPWYERDDIPFDDDPVITASEPVPSTEPAHAAAVPAEADRSFDAERSSDAERARTAETARTPEPSHDDAPAYGTGPSYSTEPAPAPAPAPGPAQPIFVQAPEAPRPRGNRGAAGLIGLLAAVVFAVLYLAAWLGLQLVNGDITFADVPQAALGALATWSLWVPTIAFYLGFWLLGAFINRGRWGHWVIWGLLVGVAAYGGHILGQLFQAPFWMLTAREGATLLEQQSLAPLAIVAFVLGRELTIWFGAWVASRGRRMTELNTEAQREYERTLEAGPQLQHA